MSCCVTFSRAGLAASGLFGFHALGGFRVWGVKGLGFSFSGFRVAGFGVQGLKSRRLLYGEGMLGVAGLAQMMENEMENDMEDSHLGV